jgi:hypothetical protein
VQREREKAAQEKGRGVVKSAAQTEVKTVAQTAIHAESRGRGQHKRQGSQIAMLRVPERSVQRAGERAAQKVMQMSMLKEGGSTGKLEVMRNGR